MSITKYFLLFIIVSIFSCNPKNVENKEDIISYDSTYFGSYYRIGKYSQEIYIYIASIIKIKDQSVINSVNLSKFRIEDVIAKSVQMGVDLSKYSPKEIYYDTILFYNKYAINQKLNLSIPYENEIHEQYLYNCIFSLDSAVVKLSVVTPPIDKSINVAKGFFNSIKIK